MHYETVKLEKKHVVGLKARTCNTDPNMTTVIGGLWQHFYEGGVFAKIEGKINDHALGLYTQYENGVEGAYDVMVCTEVDAEVDTEAGIPVEDLSSEPVRYTIPAGTYAKFVVHGHPQTAVMDFWTKLWTLDLNRAYICDFEEYLPSDDFENCEIHMYISMTE